MVSAESRRLCELAGVVGGVEVTEGFFDEMVWTDFPAFETADADAFACAAGTGVGAGESPVIFEA